MRIWLSGGKLVCFAALMLPSSLASAQAVLPDTIPPEDRRMEQPLVTSAQEITAPEREDGKAAAAPDQSSATSAPAAAADNGTRQEFFIPSAPPFSLDMARAIAGLSARNGAVEVRDRTVLAAFYGDRQGAPLWFTDSSRTEAADALVAEMRQADQWGLDPASYAMPSIRARSTAAATADQMATEEAEISAAVLRYARQARGGRVDPAALTKFLDRKPIRYDNRSVLDQIATAADPAAYLRDLHPRHPQFEALRQQYLAARGSGDKVSNPRRLLANLEQWRWMPDDLGRFHIFVNVPEYMVRIVADGTGNSATHNVTCNSHSQAREVIIQSRARCHEYAIYQTIGVLVKRTASRDGHAV